MLKVELHAHTADDPKDYISHTAHQLIDRAADLDYDALAITLHNKQLDVEPLRAYASERGLALIPGVERDIQGKHVLLINFSSRTERVDTFEDVARLKQEEPAGLVVAPHPFFPMGSCLRSMMNRHADLIDAVELNAMYSPMVNFNRAGERWAARHRTPMVGNGDVHLLEQLGTTYSMVDAARSPRCDLRSHSSGQGVRRIGSAQPNAGDVALLEDTSQWRDGDCAEHLGPPGTSGSPPVRNSPPELLSRRRDGSSRFADGSRRTPRGAGYDWFSHIGFLIPLSGRA